MEGSSRDERSAHQAVGTRPSIFTSQLLSTRALELRDRASRDAIDLTKSLLHVMIRDPERLRHLNGVLDRHYPTPRHRMLPLLKELGRVRPHGRFIQIGSHDGDQQDPLRDTILRRGWAGIMVEPVPYVFERLRNRYGDLAGVHLENVAVGPSNGVLPFYHLAPADDAGRPGLPIWYDALGSFLLDVVLSHRAFIPDIDDRVVRLDVPTVTFETLCDRHGVDSIDVLHTDTEGYDFEILKLVDFERLGPTVLIYESVHLSSTDKHACDQLLADAGYDTVDYGLDTWGFNRLGLSAREAKTLVPLWHRLRSSAVDAQPLLATRALRRIGRRITGRPIKPAVNDLFPLTQAERLYFERGYDDRTALPEGAAMTLVPDNPRLVALRSAYSAARLPATVHRMWTEERVQRLVDLPYFRGDNIYLWHYPEHPRAMALKLYVYMGYLQDRGGSEILESLSEDGAFGCWTADIPGFGLLSRDLLDSTNEMLFLDRSLDIFNWSGLRILDIGAGYGRLAHRASEAIPSLADYCCVDAVAESTFLSEYYLRMRGATPPARVVPLVDIETELKPGTFDLAVNIHSFSECTSIAVSWWLEQLQRLAVPHLFVVPNEADGILCREPDGSATDVMPLLERAGYRLDLREPVIMDPATRELVRIYDSFHLFSIS